MSKRKIFLVIFLAVISVAITLFIFANSMKTASESVKASNGFVDKVKEFLDSIGIHFDFDLISFLVRKAAHFLEYFVLGASTSLLVALAFKQKWFLALSPVYCFAVAMCDEFIFQSASEGRSPEWRDVGIDSCGMILAALSVFFVLYTVDKRRKKKQMDNL